ncbi:hypothetical protein [Campylobacter troglodytis]|uniref:hypothetical protein n=1 Tax=Campylobacter troglodytis TaxID=654363 RepID=UPI00163CC795|nr:hypothetical protein [Campylobacter troglodytis]
MPRLDFSRNDTLAQKFTLFVNLWIATLVLRTSLTVTSYFLKFAKKFTKFSEFSQI